jgi:hypothetical protein
MRFSLILIASLLAACEAAPPLGSTSVRSELADRTAGAPQRCVLIEQSESLRVSQSDPATLLYGSGKRIWANRMQPGCTFHYGDVLVSQPIGSSHCRGDLMRSFDNFTHIPGPSCVLGDFVPYVR